MNLATVFHKNYFPKIGDNHKFPINKFGELANYLLTKKIVIAGVGLDVYEKEPLPENNKLRFLPNALLTPHIGYVTAENYSIFYTQMIEALEVCVNGKPIREINK